MSQQDRTDRANADSAGPGEREVADRRSVQAHHDQYADFSHQLPDDAADASTRVLMRVVPLAYGALVGGLAGKIMLGVASGLTFAAAVDLFMGSQSMLRGLLRLACPAMRAVLSWFGLAGRRLALCERSALLPIGCKDAQP